MKKINPRGLAPAVENHWKDNSISAGIVVNIELTRKIFWRFDIRQSPRITAP
jgi:hypothetical protein